MANVKAHFTKYKNQAEAHYLLGRLESLAFSGKADSVEIFFGRARAKQLPQVPFWSWVQENTEASSSATELPPEARELFFSSVEHYRKAIALDSGAALYHFSLGWMADQGERFSSQLGSPPAGLTANGATTTWQLIAIREYREAYRLSNPNIDHIDVGPVVALQSGQALIADLQRELAQRKAKGDAKSAGAFDIADAERTIATVRANVDRINNLPRAITPLIFSMRPQVHLADLLSPNTVAFDLDGFTEGRSWPWLQRDAALLAWDPLRQGRIVSGRQLFGSVTWWMFWKNGFEPLAALDNNGDGWLTGDELDGVSVWLDRNGNGISDPGEVTPAKELGIVAIAVRSDGNLDGVPASRSGVILSDGRALTLFDWVPHGGARPISR